MTTGRKWMIVLEGTLLAASVAGALISGQLGVAIGAPLFLGLFIYDLVR